MSISTLLGHGSAPPIRWLAAMRRNSGNLWLASTTSDDDQHQRPQAGGGGVPDGPEDQRLVQVHLARPGARPRRRCAASSPPSRGSRRGSGGRSRRCCGGCRRTAGRRAPAARRGRSASASSPPRGRPSGTARSRASPRAARLTATRSGAGSASSQSSSTTASSSATAAGDDDARAVHDGEDLHLPPQGLQRVDQHCRRHRAAPVRPIASGQWPVVSEGG